MVCDSERLVKTCCRVVVWFTGCLEITAEYPDCEESWRILEWDENKSYIQVFFKIILISIELLYSLYQHRYYQYQVYLIAN